VKDADKNIIKKLKEMGRLVQSGQVKHSYPFCWRSDTPLLYRAVPSWFMRVQQMQKTLLQKNDETYWVPETIREGRFANWLKDARDWNLSRNRYWGTPIPVWISEDGEESVCIGSIAELEKMSGVKVDDLHRETVDKITIPSARPGKPPLKRISEVFDCWFESGSMPYAQMHYPFENKKEFEDAFPADFIAEGTDQTRGWFYTLLVLSTALFNKPPFKNLIVNGLVLAADGQKMSKRKKNYPDPNLILNNYGADALRLYLINSPVVKAESLRFKEEGVRDILKDVFLPWYNAFRFLLQNVETFENNNGCKFQWSEQSYGQSSNVMDRWITSFTQSLLVFVKKEMAAYRLYTVLPKLMKFIDNLTNWYVRTNRKRLKGEGNSAEDCLGALNTLFAVLFTMVRVFAPFTPFLTETMYQRLRRFIKGFEDDALTASVHYLMIPQPRTDLIDEAIERSVTRMQTVIELGRVVRDRKTMPVKYPLPELVLIHKDQQCLDDVKSLQDYVLDELNIKTLTLSTNKQQYGVMLRAEVKLKTKLYASFIIQNLILCFSLTIRP
jgi:isoleucyl-tRNA synthetase